MSEQVINYNAQLLADKAATTMCLFQDVFKTILEDIFFENILLADSSELQFESSTENMKKYVENVKRAINTQQPFITEETFLDKNVLYHKLLKYPEINQAILNIPSEEKINFLNEMENWCKQANSNYKKDTLQRQIRALNNDFRLNKMISNLVKLHDKYLDEKKKEIETISLSFGIDVNFSLSRDLTFSNLCKIAQNNFENALDRSWLEENEKIKARQEADQEIVKLWNLIEKYKVVNELKQTLAPNDIELLPPTKEKATHMNNENYKHSINRLQHFSTKFNDKNKQEILLNHENSSGEKFLLAIIVIATGIVPGLLLLAIHSKFFTSKNSFNFFNSSSEHFVNEISKDIDDVSKFYPCIPSAKL